MDAAVEVNLAYNKLPTVRLIEILTPSLVKEKSLRYTLSPMKIGV